MADKASGVYVSIKDSTEIFDIGTVVMNGIVPMKTIKGEIGPNVVTGDNLEKVLGYDLTYNPNYYGLKEMLSSVASLTVWRVNGDGGKVYWASVASGGDSWTSQGTTKYADFTAVKTGQSTAIFIIASKTPGEWDNNLWCKLTVASSIYTLKIGSKVGDGSSDDDYSFTEYTFSTDSTADNYWGNIDFGDFYVDVSASISTTVPSGWCQLKNGVNGTVPSTLDTSVLEGGGYNFCFLNGLGADADSGNEFNAISTIATACKSNKIHCFVDLKPVATNGSVTTSGTITWANSLSITDNEYVAFGARPDQVEVNGSTVYIYPSVNYLKIFANMGNSYDSYNYPPAGFSYGSIITNNLVTCDFEKGDNPTLLKTARINWQKVTNGGSVMWEQRTKYRKNSDLSYIAPVFIVDAIVKDLKTFEEGFNFRYMTRTDLLNQDSGLRSILETYVNAGFLYSYSYSIPSYEEAQRAGRTLTISVQITIMKDSEVINLNIELTNA